MFNRAYNRLLLAFGCFALSMTLLPNIAKAFDVTVAAAASLKDALEEMKPEMEKNIPGLKLLISTGGSGTLQAQISQGAPIDLFLSAAAKPMDTLAKENKIAADSRHILLTNEIVLIVPEDNKSGIRSIDDLKSTKVKRIAIGEPRSVPAGEYTVQALTKKGLAEALTPKFTFAKDVRQVLAYVERGEVDAGFVYKSDLKAKAAGKVKSVVSLPQEWHEPIVYELAAVNQTAPSKEKAQQIKKVLDYFKGQSAAKVWVKFGFQLPGEQTARLDAGAQRATK